MEGLKLKRSIIQSLESTVGFLGVREDDEFELDIFQDKKKTFKLKRTYYKITTSNKYEFDFKSAEISLPVFGVHYSSFEICLIRHSHSQMHNEKSRYLMRSLGEEPFKLNGGHCFEAFLERGDMIDIGFNRIHFLRPKSNLSVSKNGKKLSELLTEEMVCSSLNVMIEGETGTGKTTLAETIHEQSGRNGRFVHLNLSSFAPSLIESEVFGHVKGAFTGAINEKRGAILEANKGTLFLDEIDSLSIELQTKLLIFLDNHEVRHVGGGHSQKIDVRLIFASGSKLKFLLENQKMRKDFYYRLTSGVVLKLESLRENRIRIKDLCLNFEEQNGVVLSVDLIKFYQECLWPGNIRQLISHLHKKKVLSVGKKIIIDTLDYELLNDQSFLKGFEPHQLKPLEEIKMDYCLNVFIKTDKNVAKASKVLDISPNTLKALISNREKLLQLRGHDITDIDL